MNNQLIKAFTVFTGLIAIYSLVSCGSSPSNNSNDQTSALVINKIDQSAFTYRAKYGRDYEIDGNVIAKYPHFDLILFSHKKISSKRGIIYTYEITSKDGFLKTLITCNSKKPEKKYFQMEGLHFYYHSNSNGSINIYIPDQLIAKN